MILITGATGTIGSEIVKQLSATGAQVRALVRNPEKAAAVKEPGVEIVFGDLDKPETLGAALKGIDRALLLSAINPRQVELEGNFIEAAKQASTKHLVKISAMEADPDSPSTILRGHGQIEKQLEQSGIPFTHLRPNFFIQNMFSAAQTIATKGLFYQPVGGAKFSLVDVRDIAAVAVKVITEDSHEGKTYTITGPEALSFYKVAEKLSAAIGKLVTYVPASREDFKGFSLEAGMPEWFADGLNTTYAALAAGPGSTVTTVVAEVAKKQPNTFSQFAQDYAQVFKGN